MSIAPRCLKNLFCILSKHSLFHRIRGQLRLEETQEVCSPTSAQAGSALRPDQVTQGSVYLGLEKLQGWRQTNLSWQLFGEVIMSNAGWLRTSQVQFSPAGPKTPLSLSSLEEVRKVRGLGHPFSSEGCWGAQSVHLKCVAPLCVAEIKHVASAGLGVPCASWQRLVCCG